MKIYKWFTLIVTSLFTLCVIYIIFNSNLSIFHTFLLLFIFAWVWLEEVKIWRRKDDGFN